LNTLERDTVLDRLYALSGGNTLTMVEISEIASELGADEDDLDPAIAELRFARLAATPVTGPVVEITHGGIRQAEEAILTASAHPLSGTVKGRMDDRVRLLEHVSRTAGDRPFIAVDDLDELGWAPDHLWPTAHYLADRGFVTLEGFLLAITPDGLRFLRESGMDPSVRL
jgi:hypothetical protein